MARRQREGNLAGGAVAGARADQNTFMIDGATRPATWRVAADITQASCHAAALWFTTPVESLEEFRCGYEQCGYGFYALCGGGSPNGHKEGNQ